MIKHLLRTGIFIVVLASSVSPAQATGSWQAHSFLKVKGLAKVLPSGYSPTQIRHAYGFDRISATGNGKRIAVVTAYDAATVAESLTMFSKTYGLPILPSCSSEKNSSCFSVVYAEGTKPKANAGWSLEAALDVEWSHAIAPQASLFLIEAKDSSLTSLMKAVDVANQYHPDVVSMSWGGAEFSGEEQLATHFQNSTTRYVSASGDDGHQSNFPAALPQVLTVGGTSLQLDTQGNRISEETAWNGSGGGTSRYISQPAFQRTFGLTSIKRSIPDVSYAADPTHGYAVFLAGKGWLEVGGTSAGAPQWAAALTLSPTLNLSTLYSKSTSFRDITLGKNGTCTSCTAKVGYDLVTGLGTPTLNLFR